jgi:hypothetical protein
MGGLAGRVPGYCQLRLDDHFVRNRLGLNEPPDEPALPSITG